MVLQVYMQNGVAVCFKKAKAFDLFLLYVQAEKGGICKVSYTPSIHAYSKVSTMVLNETYS